MPTYTMELWQVIDMKPADVSLAKWCGLDTYPIFKDEYRDTLNQKILNNYMFQEIGTETIERWRFRMSVMMNNIMPAYNQLYKSALIEFDPLVTMDVLSTSTGTQDQTSAGVNENDTTSDIDSLGKNVVSNFPQVMLSGNADYASNGADSNSQTKTTAKVKDAQTAESNTKSDTETRTKGYQGSAAQLIQAARAIILNVDMLVINDIDPLFMSVWNNGDEYSRSKGRFY